MISLFWRRLDSMQTLVKNHSSHGYIRDMPKFAKRDMVMPNEIYILQIYFIIYNINHADRFIEVPKLLRQPTTRCATPHIMWAILLSLIHKLARELHRHLIKYINLYYEFDEKNWRRRRRKKKINHTVHHLYILYIYIQGRYMWCDRRNDSV